MHYCPKDCCSQLRDYKVENNESKQKAVGTNMSYGATVGASAANSNLRRNETPPLFDVLPFEINNENYFLLIGVMCAMLDNFPRSSFR